MIYERVSRCDESFTRRRRGRSPKDFRNDYRYDDDFSSSIRTPGRGQAIASDAGFGDVSPIPLMETRRTMSGMCRPIP